MPPVAPYRSSFSSRISKPSSMQQWQLKHDSNHYHTRLKEARSNHSQIDHFLPDRIKRPRPRIKKRRTHHKLSVESEIQQVKRSRGGWIFATTPNDAFLNRIPTPPSNTARRPHFPSNRKKKRLGHRSYNHPSPRTQSLANKAKQKMNRYSNDALSRKHGQHSGSGSGSSEPPPCNNLHDPHGRTKQHASLQDGNSLVVRKGQLLPVT